MENQVFGPVFTRRALLLAGTAVAMLATLPACAQHIPTDAPQLPRYDMHVVYKNAAPFLTVEGEVELAATAVDREYVELSLAEAIGDAKFSIVSARGATIASTIEKTVRSSGRPGWGTTSWRLRAAQKFAAGQPIRVRFSYVVPEEFAANLVYAGPVMAFGTGVSTAWYPQLEREPPAANGPLRGLRGTGRIRFEAPKDFTVFANGQSRSQRPGTFDYVFDRPIFFAFAAGRYQATRKGGAIPATAYMLRARASTPDLLSRTQAIVEFLGREFRPYPHGRFAVVEIPDEFAHKAGFDGASLEGFIYSTTEYLDKRFNTAFFAHEIGHQWWPYMLGPGGDTGIYLLTDAMVQYGSLRAVEVFEGEAAGERYRRIGHPAFYHEFSGKGFLEIAAAGLDMPLAQTFPPTHPEGRRSFSLAGSKGMLVWYMLANELGHPEFSRILRTLIDQNFYQRIPIPEFRSKFSAVAGRDMSWFFNQWLDRDGAPDLALEWTQAAGHVQGRVIQKGPLYRLTVPLAVIAPDGRSEEHLLAVSERESRFDFAAPAGARSVELDPHYRLLRWTDAYRAEAEALVPYTKANAALVGPDPNKVIPLFRQGLSELRAGERYPVAFLLHYGLTDALLSNDKYDEANAEADAALASKPQAPEVLPLLHLLRARIAEKRGDRAAVNGAIEAVFAADARSGMVSGASEQARAFQQQLRKE